MYTLYYQTQFNVNDCYTRILLIKTIVISLLCNSHSIGVHFFFIEYELHFRNKKNDVDK